MGRIYLVAFFIFLPMVLQPLFSQVIINGFVEDTATGERLVGANVYVEGTTRGTITNSYGFYSLVLPFCDTIKLAASYIGYLREIKKFSLCTNQEIHFKLIANNSIDEVIITAQNEKLERKTTMSELKIPVHQVRFLPTLFGEADLLRAYQLMPGVQSGKEGTSGLYVRGGSPDQNLFLLDDVPLYYVNHIGGFVSVFDPNAINNVTLIKGGFPARYGGRLSSVLDIRLREGNKQEVKKSYTIGLISSKFFYERPLKKDTSSFMVSVRRCNVDLITRLLSLMDSDWKAMAGYTFYDANIKFNRRLSGKDHLYLSFYGGRDKIFVNSWDLSSEYDEAGVEYKYTYKSNILWGNFLASSRWNHVFSNRLFSNTTLSYTHFFYTNDNILKTINRSDNSLIKKSQIKFNSGAADIILKNELDYYPWSFLKSEIGIAGVYHLYNPGFFIYKNLEISNDTLTNKKIHSPEVYTYIDNELKLSNSFSCNIGLYSQVLFTQNEAYPSLQPRISLRYLLPFSWALKASYAKMVQPVHLLSNSGAGLPTELWVPSTEFLEPEKSDQYAFGLAHTFNHSSTLELSAEAYYKTLSYLIELKEGISFFNGNTQWEDKVEKKGTGKIYGIEILLQKKSGKLSGWIGYSWSKNMRYFTNINKGEWYPYRYDRTHDFSIVLIGNINNKFNISATWVYGTGNPVTLAVGKYNVMFVHYNDEVEFQTAHYYNGRNTYRMPAYHRLDLGFNFIKQTDKGKRTWNISIYNAYNHHNTFFLFYKTDNNDMVKLYQVSLFPIIPSVSYSLDF